VGLFKGPVLDLRKFHLILPRILMTTKVCSHIAAILCFLVGSVAFGQNGNKIAIISIQEAVIRTQQGQKLGKEMEEKYGPTQRGLQSQGQEIQSLRGQLLRGENTMSDGARRKLTREIQSKERSLQRNTEDARQEFNEMQQKATGQMMQKMMAAIDKHARANSFSVVLDISSQQSPVLYATNEINITNDVIAIYDQDNPVAGSLLSE